MEFANKENAEAALDRARAMLEQGDADSALRFAEKSLRLHASDGATSFCDVVKVHQRRAASAKAVLAARSEYEVLGVTNAATASELKKAYHQLCLELHPDKANSVAGAADAFKRVASAYEVLSGGGSSARPAVGRPPPPPQQPFPQQQRPPPQPRRKPPSAASRGPQRGPDDMDHQRLLHEVRKLRNDSAELDRLRKEHLNAIHRQTTLERQKEDALEKLREKEGELNRLKSQVRTAHQTRDQLHARAQFDRQKIADLTLHVTSLARDLRQARGMAHPEQEHSGEEPANAVVGAHDVDGANAVVGAQDVDRASAVVGAQDVDAEAGSHAGHKRVRDESALPDAEQIFLEPTLTDERAAISLPKGLFELTLGRSDFGIRDPHVSRIHAQISRRDDDKLRVTALGANPIRVHRGGQSLKVAKDQACVIIVDDQVDLVDEGNSCSYKVSRDTTHKNIIEGGGAKKQRHTEEARTAAQVEAYIPASSSSSGSTGEAEEASAAERSGMTQEDAIEL